MNPEVKTVIKPIPQHAPIDPEILKRVKRWQEEQAAKKAKREKEQKKAAAEGLSLKEYREKKHRSYLLRECRATVAEILKEHSK